jgi:2-keto-4-pentenoate hydratase/2-oxohepta-3-ene-1,7-dioic acid hydratase in catechol pathway
VIQAPSSSDGIITNEGEPGIVIGKACSEASADGADEFTFGRTCVNDITASDILNRNRARWASA